MKILLHIQVIFLLGIFFAHPGPIEAGLTNYLPSLGILNPSNWFSFGRRAGSNSTVSRNNTAINRSDDPSNSIYLENKTKIDTKDPSPNEGYKNNSILILSPNSTKPKNDTISTVLYSQPSTTQTSPSLPTSITPMLSSMFTTKPPRKKIPKFTPTRGIKKDNRTYFVPLPLNYASIPYSPYTNAFDSSSDDKKIESRSSDNNVEIIADSMTSLNLNQTDSKYDLGSPTNSTTINDDSIGSRFWNLLTNLLVS